MGDAPLLTGPRWVALETTMNIPRLAGITALPALLLLACAKRAEVSPHAMSQAAHEAAAEAHAADAANHEAEYVPTALAERVTCANGRSGQICWTSVVNPTAAHAVEAERHAREAAEHRAASQALREAEASACVGIDPGDRDASPFAHLEDIESVRRLVEIRTAGRTQIEEETGAVVTFRAVPGLTSEWLQRVVDCHLARAAAVGHDVAGMPNCPLVPKGAGAIVSSTGSGFAVAIRGEDQAGIDEIVLRASRLVGAGP